MTGCRIAVYGLGRSGLAVARAALALGATPTVFDSARPERMVKQGVVAEAQALGVEMHFGWEGRFDPSEVDLLVPNPGVDSRSSVLRHARQHGIEIASEIEFAYRVLEARELAPPPQYLAPIVAITGTNGKSTTTVMTYLALRECGIDAVLCGNVFGTGYPEITMTEAALNAKAGQVLVAEVSSFQLEWVSRFRAAVAGITNIAPDHLDRYDSFEDYAATKKRIFAGQQPEDYKVVHRGIGFQPMSAAEADATIIKRQAANLPHWTAEHGTYAVRSSSADAAGFQPADPGLEGPGTHRLEADATGSRLGRLPHVLTFGPDGDFAQVNEQEIRILDRAIPTSDMKVVGAHNYSNASMAGLLAYATLVWIIRNEPRPLAMSRLMSMAQVIDARIDQTSRNAETDQTGKHKTAKTWAL
ncbi:MAG TPA: Mur ligase family protein, partial [Fimbriimonadaceae bacterium]|nr:Mur ligase family protein [Fimbriimonadaceae bacterium]